MIIALDNVWESEKWNEKVVATNKVRLNVASHCGRFKFIMSTSDFSIECKDGLAHVRLSRDISTEQVRELAAALLKKADEDEAERLTRS